jgi:hypothetical protein
VDVVEKIETAVEGMLFKYQGSEFRAPMRTHISGPLHKRVSGLIIASQQRERQLTRKYPQLIELELLTKNAEKVQYLRENMGDVMTATEEVEALKQEEEYTLTYGIAQAAIDRSNMTPAQIALIESDPTDPDGFWADQDFPALKVAVAPFRDRMGM